MNRKYLGLVFGFSLLLLTGCDLERAEKMTKDVKQARNNLRSATSLTPASQKNIKTYFSSIKALALEADRNGDFAKWMREAVKKTSGSSACTDLVVSRSDWNRVKQICQQKTHFLCVDDVLSYEKSMEILNQRSVLRCDL